MNRTNLVGLLVVGAALGATAVALAVQLWPGIGPVGPDEAGVEALAPAPAPEGVPDRQTERPNIVMIVACTLRRDMLTPYGAPPEASPFLAKLAAGGARFADSISAAPWTKAASTALMTGHHPIQVGMTEPRNHANRRRLSEEVTTLAEYLDGAGYETLGLTANPNTNELFGFAQGFDHYSEPKGLWGKGGSVNKSTTRQLADRALKRVDAREDPDAPMYLRLMVIDVHEPIRTNARKVEPFLHLDLPRRVISYLSMVRQLDTGIEHLWSELNARGYNGDNTVFMLVNDHGEGLRWPELHGHGHGNHVQATTVRMPWIVYGEGVAEGHVIEGMASQVDVLPTILGLADIPSDYAGPGHDWSAQVQGTSGRTTRTEAYADTWFHRSSRAAIYTEPTACLHDFLDLAEQLGEERLVPRTSCYDRKADPLQAEPKAPDQALLAQLKAWREARVADNESWPHHEDIRVTDEVASQLEALGYVQGDDLGDEPAHVESKGRKGRRRRGKRR